MGDVIQCGHGQIVCENVHGKKTLKRFVEKRISKWMAEKVDTRVTVPWEYYAIFGKQGRGHDVNCYLELMTESGVWQGAEVGDGVQAALIRCLNKMKFVEEPRHLEESGANGAPKHGGLKFRSLTKA